jgi:hypothetical protein
VKNDSIRGLISRLTFQFAASDLSFKFTYKRIVFCVKSRVEHLITFVHQTFPVTTSTLTLLDCWLRGYHISDIDDSFNILSPFGWRLLQSCKVIEVYVAILRQYTRRLLFVVLCGQFLLLLLR